MQAVASTAMLHHDRTAWLADAAPEPRDVIWSNLGYGLVQYCPHACSIIVILGVQRRMARLRQQQIVKLQQ